MNSIIPTVVVLLTVVTHVGQTAAPKTTRRAAAIAREILDLRHRDVTEHRRYEDETKSPEWRMGELLGRLEENRTRTGDEALAALLGYYLGESNSYDMLEETTRRGKRMLPYLTRFRGQPPAIPGRSYPLTMLPNGRWDTAKYDAAIDAIQKGIILR